MERDQLASRDEWQALLSDYVRNALSERLQTWDSPQFNSLLFILDDFASPDKRAQTKATVEAVTQHVSLIDRDKHEALLNKVYGTSFWVLSTDIVDALCSLTVCLVSACPTCLVDCLSVLVSHFTPPPVEMSSVEPLDQSAQRQLVIHEVHGALTKVVELVPAALPILQQVILQRMPHKHMSKEVHQQYLRNTFRVAELPQAGAIREGLLLGIISRLLEVDVEIKYEDLDDLDDFGEEDDGDALFDFEDASRATPPGSSPHTRPLDETADKLDGMMDIVFAHLGRRISSGDFDNTLQTLLRALQTSLLQTYKSKFTQFLIFYVCARDENENQSAATGLCDVLYERLANVAYPPILRVAAASYMASFLARASFLSSAFLMQRLLQLSTWATAFVDRHEEAVASGSDAKQSQDVFDAVCQGVLYVLCYRMDAMADGGTAPLAQLRSLPLDRLLNHALQPLRACAPAIAHEYSRRAKHLRLQGRSAARAAAQLHSVDEANAARSSRQTRPLDTFFPFDPYLLRASSAQLDLKRSYIRWHASDALDADGYGSDGPSEASGLDERSSSQAADDSYRDVYGMAMHVGLAKPAPLVTTMAMSYEEAAMHLSGSSFGGLSLH